MRSMWKGAVSFGLVMIPVKLYTATETKDIAFRQVHREDGGRIRFRRFCTVDDNEVPYEDIAKGYELPDGEIVILTDDDMADLPLPTTRNIEVVQFCPAEQLDPILFNKSYYLEPEAAGTRAYTLLLEALERSGKIAVAQVALRQRESLAVLRARDGVLVLETLLWPDEVRVPDFKFLDDKIDVRPQELKMASSLIESMTLDFDPEEYHDSYREALAELVDAKVAGREIVAPVERGPEQEEPSSLADALRASLAAAKGGRVGAAALEAPEEDEVEDEDDEVAEDEELDEDDEVEDDEDEEVAQAAPRRRSPAPRGKAAPKSGSKTGASKTTAAKGKTRTTKTAATGKTSTGRTRKAS